MAGSARREPQTPDAACGTSYDDTMKPFKLNNNNARESQLTQIASLHVLWACVVFAFRAADARWCDAVPIAAADRDARLNAQNPQDGRVFPCA